MSEPPLKPPHRVADRSRRRGRHQHTHGISGQHAAEDAHTRLDANLSAESARKSSILPGQRVIAVLRLPNDVIAMAKDPVRILEIQQDQILWGINLCPCPGSFPQGVDDPTLLHAATLWPLRRKARARKVDT